MTIDDAVKALDKNYGGEEGHMEADSILLEFVPDEVKDAYIRLTNREDFWYA